VGLSGKKNALPTTVKRGRRRNMGEQDALQSYLHLHRDLLCAIVMDSVIREILIFILVTSSACIYMRATVEISSVLDEAAV
jgi:hypothetical protein